MAIDSSFSFLQAAKWPAQIRIHLQISLVIRPHVKVLIPIWRTTQQNVRMGGPTNEADGGNFSAVSRKCSTLLELVVLNCSDDADPTAPGKELEEPSMVLCGSVPGLDVIGSSDDGSNSSSSEDETSASCRVSSDAESATSSSDLDEEGEIIDQYRLQRGPYEIRVPEIGTNPLKRNLPSDPLLAENTLGREARHSH